MKSLTLLIADPNIGDPASSRDNRAATLVCHAAPPRSPRSRDRDAVPCAHAQSSPHRAECRAGPASSHPRQTSFPLPFRSATEPQLSCVSYSVLLSITAALDPRVLLLGTCAYRMQTLVPGASCAVPPRYNSLFGPPFLVVTMDPVVTVAPCDSSRLWHLGFGSAHLTSRGKQLCGLISRY